MGVKPAWLAKRIGCEWYEAEKFCGDDPKPPLSYFLRAISELGIKMRVMGTKKRIWISIKAIDALCFDPEWRSEMGLELLPKNRKELARIVKYMRNRHKRSYLDIQHRMERNWVPTNRGHREWKNIAAYLREKKVSMGSEPLGYAEDFARCFRPFVMAELLMRLVKQDPLSALRYSLSVEITDRAYIFPEKVMPECQWKWMFERLENLKWFSEEEYGEEEESGAPTGDQCGSDHSDRDLARPDGGGQSL